MNNSKRRAMNRDTIKRVKRATMRTQYGKPAGFFDVKPGPFPRQRERPKGFIEYIKPPRGFISYNDNRRKGYL